MHHGNLRKEGTSLAHHFVFTKLLVKEAIAFILHNCFFSNGNIIMIQIIEIPMGSDPALFFANLFYSTKKLTRLRHNVNLEQSMLKK